MPCFFGGIFKDKDFNMIFFLTGGATGGVVWLDFAKRDSFFPCDDGKSACSEYLDVAGTCS